VRIGRIIGRLVVIGWIGQIGRKGKTLGMTKFPEIAVSTVYVYIM